MENSFELRMNAFAAQALEAAKAAGIDPAEISCSSNESFSARARLGNTTFWVGFTQEGADSYLVHRAYSHRMQVERRQG